MRRIAAGLVLATAPAAARPPAPGAPGPPTRGRRADKHGFGTAHQVEGNAYLTLRAGVAE